VSATGPSDVSTRNTSRTCSRALGGRWQQQDTQRILADVAAKETAQAILADLNQRIAEPISSRGKIR